MRHTLNWLSETRFSFGNAEKMPASYKIDKEQRLVLSSGTGVVTAEDMWAHQRQLSNDKDFDPSFSQLVDLTGVTAIGFTPDDVHGLAERSIFSPQSRRAFVAKRDLLYGLARMFELLREARGKDEIQVFRDRNEALEWLFAEKRENG
jgi:hypothetical protein